MNPKLIHKAGIDLYEIRHTQKPLLNIVLFHGYGAIAHDLISLSSYLDVEGQYNWFFPEGLLSLEQEFGMSNARAWFPIVIEELTAMEPRDYSAFLPDGFIDAGSRLSNLLDILRLENCVLGGFSQGAIMTTELAITSLLPIKGILLYSGTLINQSRWEESLLKKNVKGARVIPFFQSHGVTDSLLPFSLAKDLFAMLNGVSCFEGTFHDFNGGHEIPPDILNETKGFLTSLEQSSS